MENLIQNYKKYLWLVPALFVSFEFAGKFIEGFAFSEEFQAIISVIPFLKPIAYYLTPAIGLLDLIIGLALILNPFTLQKAKLQKVLFVWTALWPFLPASLRYFGGVAEFEINAVLATSLCSVLACFLWNKFNK
jgi:hypothetical protein